jgi:hypothetical protein
VKPFLIDGPMMLAVERREAVTQRMAKDLIHSGALACDQDAIRLLHNRGYALFDIALLAGDARMLAFQDIVAAEMSKP